MTKEDLQKLREQMVAGQVPEVGTTKLPEHVVFSEPANWSFELAQIFHEATDIAAYSFKNTEPKSADKNEENEDLDEDEDQQSEK